MIGEYFARTFATWHIALPEEDLRQRRAGFLAEAGWLIQYCFGSDDSGEYLDFYAAHRMTDDSHTRVYEDGRVVALPALIGMRVMGATPQEEERLEREYVAHNRAVAQALFDKGFDRFTINMALHAGFDGSDDGTGNGMQLEDNSVELVAPRGDAKGFDKTFQEKWLIYCPEIANDTLLYMITAGDSYSIRSYGGTSG